MVGRGIPWMLAMVTAAAAVPSAVGSPPTYRPFLVLAPGSEALFLDLLRSDRPGLPKGWTLESIGIEGHRARATWQGPGGRTAILDLLPPGSEGPQVVGRTPWATLRVPDPRAAPPRGLIRAVLDRLSRQRPRIPWERRVDPLAVPAEAINRPRISPGSGPGAAELEQAAQALRDGAREEALIRIERVLGMHDLDRQAIRFGARLLRGAGEAVRALPSLERTVGATGAAISPEEALEFVATLEAAGRTETAAQVAREQAARNPDRFPSPSCLRAEALALLIREGTSVDAMVGNGPFPLDPSRGPASRCAWLLQLHRDTARKDGDAVIRTARAALEAFPEDRDILYLWGHFFFVQHRLDQALDPWDRLAALEPTYPSLMSLYGTAYLVSGRLQKEGIEALLDRHRKRPDDAVAAYLAGLGLFYQKEYPRVIPLLTQAAAAVPEDPRPAMYLAMAHFFTGDRDEAVRILEGLERFTWQEPDINYCRSLVYRSTDLPRAIREMETFLRVFEGEDRVSFGPQKVQKARSDLERMRRGEVPEVFLPQPDGWDAPVLEVQQRIAPPHPEAGHDP